MTGAGAGNVAASSAAPGLVETAPTPAQSRVWAALPRADLTSQRFVLAFVALATAARLIEIFGVGLQIDEVYAITLSRTPALSYFDHPPLHQWVVTLFARAFGEGRQDRLPFLALILLTSVGLYGLTQRLFSRAAAWSAVFAFNACAYFLLLPGGYIRPDQPMLPALVFATWAVAEILYGPPGRAGVLWAAAGLLLGLAGLSKYSAVFAPLSLAGFLVFSPRHRHWLWDPRPYAGAALGLACMTPALVWNAEHHWVSFGFQTGRAVGRLRLDGTALGAIAFGLLRQFATFFTPWIVWPLTMGLWRGARAGADRPERLLLWLAAPPLLVFTFLPITGQNARPHWFDSGWLFAFPLAGAWLADRSAGFRGAYARFAATAAGLILVGHLLVTEFGDLVLRGGADPTALTFEWPAAPLREAFARSGARFALVEEWGVGVRLAAALGPGVPLCGMGDDPRHYAFACDARDHLGQDGFIVRSTDRRRTVDEAPFFASVAPMGELRLRPGEGREHVLSLSVGRDLKSAPPLPYGP